MTPRAFINFFRSPMGALLVFVVLIGIILTVIITLKPQQRTTSPTLSRVISDKPQIVETVEREITKFTPPKPQSAEPKQNPSDKKKNNNNAPSVQKKVSIPPISLFSDTPTPKADPPLTGHYAPFGRLIRCQLIVTVDSSSINTPIIGVVTHDVWHDNQLIIPAGTEVHGAAQTDRARERIASAGSWNFVWKDGKELTVRGFALDREKNADNEGWAITDGSAGLRGRLLKTDNLAEIKLFAATFLSGAADALTDREQTITGSQSTPSLDNAPFEGAQNVLSAYAQQILNTIQQDGFYVRVPAGKQFYVYVNQTIDVSKATIGGAQLSHTTSP